MTFWLAVAVCLASLLWLVTAFRLGQERRKYDRLQLDLRIARERADQANHDRNFLNALNQSFVDQAPSAMLLVDNDRKVVYFNPAAASLFRLPLAWAEGKSLIEVVRDHDFEAMVRRALRGTSEAEVLEVRPPGTDLILQATARPILDEQKKCLGATVVVQDLTELHRLDAIRREFVSNVSHELRTPLATIKALVETLEGGALDERKLAIDFLGKINRELDGLTALVRDLLELSRIESGRLLLHTDTVVIREVLEDTLARLQATADRQGLSLELDGAASELVLADAARVAQVVVNLVQNAIKFTQLGGHIVVRFRAQGDEELVAVSDTGIGIPSEDLPRVFERFYKVDKARSRSEVSGTGLGLAIAKHLVQTMGGRIWAESIEGQGSTFFFTLPLAVAAAVPQNPPPASIPA